MKTKLLFLLLFISVSCFAQDHPYTKLERNLDGVGKLHRGWFTVFCNLDLNFVDGRFSRFLQNSDFAMTIDDESVKISPTSFGMKYVPRVSSKTEYINIMYHVTPERKHDSWLGMGDGKARLIKKVEITGTTEMVLNLFISYWQYNLNVEDNKIGEIANYNVMGDRISLTRLDSKQSKIVITPKDFDYTESFGIN